VNPAGTTLGLLMTVDLGDGIAGRFFLERARAFAPL
jgi:hypothetical protein